MSLNKDIQTKEIPPPHSNEAVPFVTFNESTKKFIINEEAIKIISKDENKQIGILSLVGKYRTGKSFLLNRVLIDKKSKKGFDVGPTIKPCTKGIWLWSSPLIINNKYSSTPFPAYIIDTEGLGAYDEEINHDSKIFLIAILISSLFIYNSFGTIDEAALNNLSLILNLSKSLKIRNNSNSLNTNDINDEEEMAKYFPSLLWILRDFALKLEDSDGNVITANQYLENALNEQKGSTESIEEKNLVRKMIKTYFLERDCFPMVRPVEKERDLQLLQTLSDNKIRPEFLKQSEMLRNKIFMKIKPKNFNGKLLSGHMLINLLESIISAINEGAIPVIENSWKYITNNECLKSIRENVDYFIKIIKDYQKENIANPNFFNDLQEFSQTMIDEIVNKFRDENSKRFDDINEYVHKLKLNLNQEYKKLNEENIILLKEKYILDLDKEINALFQNKDKSKENHINFISDLLLIKYRLDNSIPDFHLKDQISYDKIIDSIKKYIEEYFVKEKNSIEQEIQNLKMQNQLLEEKYNNISEEYKKDKEEYKQAINNYNDMLIENKLKLKTNEEKIKNFELEKKTLKETNERTINENKKGFEEKIEKMKLELNKLKLEIKAKEEDLLVSKLNNDKVSALNIQKISLLEKECEQWKERYNSQSKELSENKNSLLNLNSELDKLKAENKNLRLKQGVLGIDNLDKKNGGTSINFFPNNTTNSIGNNNSFGSTKLLIELLNEQNDMKDSIKDLTNKTNDLIHKNTELIIENKKLTFALNNKRPNSNNLSLNSNNSSSNNLSLNNINNNFESNDKLINRNSSKLVNRDDLFSKVLEKNEDIFKKEINNDLFPNYNNFNYNLIKDIRIKIVNSVLKKDITGKPFLEYVCEVKNGKEKYTLNKKFGHFIMLYKALKTSFKDSSKLPNGGNLFTNISEMKQNSFHENKLEQLEKYINELLKIEEIRNSLPFTNFFELNEKHEQIISDNLANYKISLEKKE